MWISFLNNKWTAFLVKNLKQKQKEMDYIKIFFFNNMELSTWSTDWALKESIGAVVNQIVSCYAAWSIIPVTWLWGYFIWSELFSLVCSSMKMMYASAYWILIHWLLGTLLVTLLPVFPLLLFSYVLFCCTFPYYSVNIWWSV